MELLSRNRRPARHILLLVHCPSKRTPSGRGLGNVQSQQTAPCRLGTVPQRLSFPVRVGDNRHGAIPGAADEPGQATALGAAPGGVAGPRCSERELAFAFNWPVALSLDSLRCANPAA